MLPERFTAVGLRAGPDHGLLIEDPLTDDERRAVAQRCEQELELGFPMVVDGVDDAASRAFAAWPDRLYLLDLDGRVVYRSRKGADGFRPDELGRTVEQLLASQRDAPGGGR